MQEVFEYGRLRCIYEVTVILHLDLEKVIREAERKTKDLEAEKVRVTEKPQTDPECLR